MIKPGIQIIPIVERALESEYLFPTTKSDSVMIRTFSELVMLITEFARIKGKCSMETGGNWR